MWVKIRVYVIFSLGQSYHHAFQGIPTFWYCKKCYVVIYTVHIRELHNQIINFRKHKEANVLRWIYEFALRGYIHSHPCAGPWAAVWICLELPQELTEVTDTHRINSTRSTPWPRRAVQQVGQSWLIGTDQHVPRQGMSTHRRGWRQPRPQRCHSACTISEGRGDTVG